MGKLSDLQVALTNPQGVYFAGQTVDGHAVVQLTEDMELRGIRLRFEGEAALQFTEHRTRGHGDNRSRETMHYRAREAYFEQDVLLAGQWPNHGSDKMRLPVGAHSFPFSFLLPPQLPSSFEGTYGHVRYSVKVILDRPWKFDHTCKRPFTVITLLDLNLDPNALTPAQCRDEKTLCCLCCASGPISAEFRLQRRGFVPGEPIALSGDVRNNSNRKMDRCFITLIQTTYYHGTCPFGFPTRRSKEDRREVARINSEGPIEGGQSYSWEGQHLVIPPCPPSYLAGCSIIDVKYVLQLNVDPSGPALDLEIPLEIIIGTIPLRHVMEQQFPIGPAPGGGIPLTTIPNMPPPSYGQSVFGAVDVRNEETDDAYTRGTAGFAPVYTYYDCNQQP